MYNDIAYTHWRNYVEQQCPDVTIVWENNRNSTQSLIYQAKHGDMADIVAIRRFENDSAAELAPYLMDLTNNDMTSTFTSESLVPFTFNDQIEWYPAPGMMEAFYANTTLFNQYGIKIPETIAELESACSQFAAVGIDGLNMDANTGYRSTFLTEGMTYSDYFETDEGQAWLKGMYEGKLEGLPDDIANAIADMYRSFVENQVLSTDDLTSSLEDTKMKFAAEKAAMYADGSDVAFVGNSMNTYQVIPSLGKSRDSRTLYTYPVFSTAVSKEVEKDSTKKKAVDEVMQAMYSEQAQSILAEGTEALISYNKDIDLPISSIFESVSDLITNKKYFIRFLNRNTFTAVSSSLKKMITKDMTDAEFSNYLNSMLLKEADTTIIGKSNISAGNQLGEKYPLQREAASVIAQCIQDSTGADLALIEGKSAASPIYKTEYTNDDLNAAVLDDSLYSASLYGDELQDVFNASITATTTYKYSGIEPLVDYPAIAGMKAYLSTNGKDNTLKLNSGESLDSTKKYTVVISGTILSALQYFQNEYADAFQPMEKSQLEIFKEYLVRGVLPAPKSYFEVEVEK